MNQYFFRQYLTKPRFISFWHQIDEVLNAHPKTVLEIGKGCGLVTDILRGYGIDVKTIDIDKNLNPDFIGDIRTYKFTRKFDVVLCAEVLEHLPFSDFEKTLNVIRRVTKNRLIITLPEAILTYFHFSLKLIPFIPKFSSTIKIYDWNKKIKPDHLWEVGQKDTPLAFVEKTILSNFKIVKTYQLDEIRHRFFILC